MRNARSLSFKLNLLFALPLVALVITAGLGVRNASHAADRARATRDEVDLSLAAAHAARELALEADLSITDGASALAQQRRSTDETVAHLRTLIEQDSGSSELSTGLALDGLGKLDTTRDAIDGDDSASTEVLGAFAKITDSVLGLDRVMESTSDPKVVNPLTAHIALTRVIQESTRERGVVAEMLSVGTIDPAAYQTATELAARQRLWFTQFENAASSDTLRAYSDAQAVPAVATVERLRQSALAGGPGGQAEGNPGVWGRAVQARIDLLEGIAEDTAEQLSGAADARVTAAERSRSAAMMWLLVTLGAGAMLFFLLQHFDGFRRSLATTVTATEPLPTSRLDAIRGERADSNSVFLNFGRRTEQLVASQLQHIDALEAGTKNPDTLSDLFVLDHLATRLRRNAESLVVLAGADSPRRWDRPVSVSNVVRAAVAETADYSRVVLAPMAPATLAGASANDTSHLLAELVDNALAYSPRTSVVSIDGQMRSDGSYLVSVADAGPGMSDAELAEVNEVLAGAMSSQDDGSRYFGLYVVGQLGRRHGVSVRLVAGRHRGLVAEVLCPESLVHPVPTPLTSVFAPPPEVDPAQDPAPERSPISP